MSLPLPGVVRVNHATFGWNSCAFTVDGQNVDGFTSIDYEEQLEVRVVYSNVQDALPLGYSAGRYQVAKFPIRVLRDTAKAIKAYLSAQALLQGVTSFGQVPFELGLHLTGDDAPDFESSITVFAGCRIVNEKATTEEGTGALSTEFSVACLGITQDGASIWNALPALVGGLPAVDTITVAGSPAPGKWTLLRGAKVYGWDIRQGNAFSGATVVPKGDELVKPRFLVELWTPADYQLFQAFRSAFLKKPLVAVPGATLAQALGIDHPELKALGCTSVVVAEINPLLNDGFGVFSCEVEFLQYRPPKPALSKPNAATPDVTTPKPTALTQTEIELQQEQTEQQDLTRQYQGFPPGFVGPV